MMDKEQINNELKAHREWAINRVGSPLNWSDADLRMADFSETYLAGADLSRANLCGADLTVANLSGADLTGADLTGADLTDANLRGANLINADLRRANFTGADLTGADLSGADLRDLKSLKLVDGDGYKIVSIKSSNYFVAVTEHQLQIGCKLGTHTQWKDEGWRVENLSPAECRYYSMRESILWGFVRFVIRTE